MKKIILIILISLFVTGCGSKELETKQNNFVNEQTIPDYEDQQEEKEYNQVFTNEEKNENIPSSIEEPKQETKPNQDTLEPNVSSPNFKEEEKEETITYSNKDNIAISSIETINQNVDDLLKKEKSEDTKSKLKGVFITLVDFVFYDGQIKGVTFNELTDAGKTKVLNLIKTIDEKIENYFPNYKENISTKTKQAFTKASEIIKNGANNLNNFAKDKLGEEYYQEIIDSKDELVLYTKNALSIVGDISSNLFTKAKDSLKNWYENFKNK